MAEPVEFNSPIPLTYEKLQRDDEEPAVSMQISFKNGSGHRARPQNSIVSAHCAFPGVVIGVNVCSDVDDDDGCGCETLRSGRQLSLLRAGRLKSPLLPLRQDVLHSSHVDDQARCSLNLARVCCSQNLSCSTMANPIPRTPNRRLNALLWRSSVPLGTYH